MNHRILGMSAIMFFIFFSVIGSVVGIAEFPPPEREVGVSIGNETTTVYNEEEIYLPTAEEYIFNVSASEEPEFQYIERVISCYKYGGWFDWTWWMSPEEAVCEIVDANEGTVRSTEHEINEEYVVQYDYRKGDAEFFLGIQMGMFRMLAFIGAVMSVVGVLLVAGTNILGSGLNIPHSFLFSLIIFFTFVLYLFYLVETMFTELPLIAKAVTVYPMLVALVYSGLTEIRD